MVPEYKEETPVILLGKGKMNYIWIILEDEPYLNSPDILE